MRCRPLYRAIDAYLDGEMSFLDRTWAQLHLMMCARCRTYLKQYAVIREKTAEIAASQLPEDFEQVLGRVFARWKDES